MRLVNTEAEMLNDVCRSARPIDLVLELFPEGEELARAEATEGFGDLSSELVGKEAARFLTLCPETAQLDDVDIDALQVEAQELAVVANPLRERPGQLGAQVPAVAACALELLADREARRSLVGKRCTAQPLVATQRPHQRNQPDETEDGASQ